MHGDDENGYCLHEDHWANGEHDHSGLRCGMMGGGHSDWHGSGMRGSHMGDGSSRMGGMGYGHGGMMGGRG
jgi:hypothetical protein